MVRRVVATLSLGLLLVAGLIFGALTHRPPGIAAQQSPPPVAGRPVVPRLTADDVRSAERNLYPGPDTALQLADRLALTPAQRQDLRALQQRVDSEMNAIGRHIAGAERRLDFAFAQGNVTPARIDSITAQIGALQGRLRAARLRGHLAARDLLTPDQLLQFARLRGYQSAPPDLFDDLDQSAPAGGG